MKYSQSYKDWKKRFSKSSIVGRGKRTASIIAIVAIVVPFLFPVGVVAQIVPFDTEVDEVVNDEVVLNEGNDVVESVDKTTPEEEDPSESNELKSEASLVEEVVNEVPKVATIYAHKVVCENESNLPNWGGGGTQAGEPATITSSTAEDFVAASGGNCSLQTDWDFQYGFAEKENTSGVHKLIGTHVGPADGTSTLGMCPPTYCGVNTDTGTGYQDWKNFDTSTSVAGTVPAKVEIEDLDGAPGVWVREVLPSNYVPFSYPPDASPGGEVSAEMYCHNDIQNFDNYDQVQYVELGEDYHCVAFNVVRGPQISALKVVCLTEASLPNWGDAGLQTGEPSVITSTTASEFLATHEQDCKLQEDWSFQYGFAEKDNTSGVNKLPGAHIGPADGTSTLGDCPPTFCGVNTFTGTDYHDWKNFDTSTSANGVVAASVVVDELEGAPGIWVRENLQDGYVPFSYPPDGAPGSSISAEMYCHTDIQNFDNYDQIEYPVPGEKYYCVAFNALKIAEDEDDELGSISGFVFKDLNNNGVQDSGEENMNGWRAYIDLNNDNDFTPGEPFDETSDETNEYLIEGLGAGIYTVRITLKPNYTQTYPVGPDEHVVNLAASEDRLGVSFGVYYTNPGNGGGGNSSRSSRTGRVLGFSTEALAPVVTPMDKGGVAGANFEVPKGRTLPRTGIPFVWLMVVGFAAGVAKFSKSE